MTSNWLRKCAFCRPSFGKAKKQSIFVYPKDFRPSDKRVRFSVPGDPSGSAVVSSLLALCSPAAVFRGVVSVIVDAVNRVFIRRSFAHVCEEVVKRCLPSIANTNSPAAIVGVSSGRRDGASLPDASPGHIF